MKTLDEVIKAFSEVNKEVGCGDCQFNDTESDDIPCELNDCIFNDALHYLKEYQSSKDELNSTRLAYLDILTDYVALKQYWAEQQENPPLTWDELKEMEGKPVWMERKNSELYHMWGLVARIKRYQGHEYAVIKCSDLCNSPMKDIRIYDIMFPNDDWQVYRKERK